MLAALSGQVVTMLVAGGSIAAVIILFLVFKAMSRPVTSDEGVEANRPQPTNTSAGEEAVVIEKKPIGTPGFVLPPPDATFLHAVGNTAQAPVQTVTAPPKREAPPPLPLPGPRAMDETITTSERPMLASPAVKPAVKPMVSRCSRLIFLNGPHQGDKINLDGFTSGECAVGRSEVPENQIVIRDDLKVSRVRHAIFTRDDLGAYSVRDNNSANKVYVNGQCIESAQTALQPGDQIRIGLTEFEYVNDPIS